MLKKLSVNSNRRELWEEVLKLREEVNILESRLYDCYQQCASLREFE